MDRDKAQELLQKILDVWYIPEGETGNGTLRGSNSGKKPRYLAFDLGEYPKAAQESRTTINFAYGDLVHDWIRDQLVNSGKFEVLDRELEVEMVGWPGVVGHVDMRLKDLDTGEIFLVDIKTLNHIGFLYLDPLNKTNNRYWATRNYTVYTPEAALNDDFMRSHMYQIVSYADAMAELQKPFDHVCFLYVCKSTGHLAIGFIEDIWEYEYLLDERDESWSAAIEDPNPYNHPLCYEPDGDTPHTVCQYCEFRYNCFDFYEITTDKGKPVFKIKEVINGTK